MGGEPSAKPLHPRPSPPNASRGSAAGNSRGQPGRSPRDRACRREGCSCRDPGRRRRRGCTAQAGAGVGAGVGAAGPWPPSPAWETLSGRAAGSLRAMTRFRTLQRLKWLVGDCTISSPAGSRGFSGLFPSPSRGRSSDAREQSERYPPADRGPPRWWGRGRGLGGGWNASPPSPNLMQKLSRATCTRHASAALCPAPRPSGGRYVTAPRPNPGC